MSKLEDSAKGEKSFGMMIYEPPYMCTRVTCPDGHLFRRVEIASHMYGGVRGALRHLMAEPSTRLPLVLFRFFY